MTLQGRMEQRVSRRPIRIRKVKARASLVAQQIKDLPALQETWVVGKIPWRCEWQPTPVVLLGEFHGQRSLPGYSPWGNKESDTAEQLSQHIRTSAHPIDMY